MATTIKYSADFVEQQCWAYLTTVLKFPETSAAAIMGSWANESNRGTTTPDPTSIEGIYDEHLELGSKKQAAMSNWNSYGSKVAVSSFYTASDGVTYPGMAMWAATGNNVLKLFDAAKKLNQQWYDIAPQLEAWKSIYIDGSLDSGRASMLSKLKSGDGNLTTLTAYAYGLIAYGTPFYQVSAADSAQKIYDKHKGKKYSYTGSSSGVNKCEEFVKKALSYKGTSASDWAAKHPKWYHAGVWCADFVSACGEEVEILGKVFDGSASAYTCAHSVEKYGGKVHTEASYSPQRGDLVNFMWNGGSSNGYADHIGIVTEYKDGTVYTIEGNTSNQVATRSYSRSSNCLSCFCTPDWSRVGGSSSSGGVGGQLYDYLNTREDAIVREVAYVKPVYDKKKKQQLKNYEIIVKEDNIKISIGNFTELFATYWSIAGGSLGSNTNSDYSKLDPKVREVVQFLVGKGLNNAAACGIAGNIWHESKFNTAAVGDNGTSFGICQWHLGRGDAMKKAAGSDWANNLTGQLEYLWTELNGSYSSVLRSLQSVSNDESGCKSAADTFVRKFEVPANVDSESQKRQAKAVEYFKQITTTVSSNNSNISFSSVNLKNLTGVRKERIERAYTQLERTKRGEVKYKWATTGPYTFDCSGFVSYCLSGEYSRIGTTYTFLGWPHTSNPQPGDVCTNEIHCGLYIGDGKMVHCSTANGIDGVMEGPVQSGMVYVTYGT